MADKLPMTLLQKIDDFLAVIEKSLIVILFFILTLIILINIIFRNFFQISFHTLLGIAPAFVVWLALLGATLGLKYQRHIKLELVLRYCSKETRRAAGAAVGIFGALVMGILFFASLEFVGNEVAIFGSRGWFSIIFPVFFAIACFRYVLTVITPFNRQKLPEPIAPTRGKPSAEETIDR